MAADRTLGTGRPSCGGLLTGLLPAVHGRRAGFWWTPFSPKVNTLWTGVVEVFGGGWLLFGAAAPLLGLSLPPALGPVVSDGALTLWLLTIVVTPANIYALTHGANFPLDVETPPTAHAVRLAFQSVLLAMFWEMAQPTVLDFKVNMGLM